MGTRAGFTIIEKSHEKEFTRHWDGYPSGVANDLKYVDEHSVLDMLDKLNLDDECESGIEYQYDINVVDGTIKAYDADWRTDERKDLLFEGSIKDFVEKFNN